MTLLLLGAIAFIAVYLLSRRVKSKGSRNKRRRQRLATNRTFVLPHWPWSGWGRDDGSASFDLNSEDPNRDDDDTDLPSLGLDGGEDSEDDVRILPTIRHEKDEPPQAPATTAPPETTRQKAKRRQMELELSSAQPEPVALRSTASANSDLLVLYVRATQPMGIPREDLLAAMEHVGMRFGAMRIYHHHGIGSSQSALPVFSVANMYEPGHLDVDDASFNACLGLAMFLQLPAPCDGPVAVELFINTAQRLAQMLHAPLLGHDHRPLSASGIEELRARAARFGTADAG